MPRCHIGLGGNIGDVRGTIEQALAALPRHGLAVVRRSRLYDTTPVGSQSDRYLNAAATVETQLAPENVLKALQQIENAAGRTRAVHWGPRTLDLDLLLYGDEQLHSRRLILPHPGLWYRRFALDPMAEIAGDDIHPVFCVSINVLRERLRERPLPVHLCGEPREGSSLANGLNVQFGPDLLWVPEPAAAAIVLQTGDPPMPVPPHALPRTIDLRSEPHALRRAHDILTAALDEPRPLD